MRALTGEQIETMLIEAMRRDDWGTAGNLETRLDQLRQHKPPVSIVSAALYYASIGLRVFALQPAQKVPHRGSRGCLEATSDPAQIEAWWRRWPDSNVAIATGHLVDVIDIDGPVGVKSWAVLYPTLPPMLGTVSTPRAGGNHLYVAAVEGRGNKAAIAPGVDYRGVGGYVVGAPSVSADGVAYRWRKPLNLEMAV